MTLEEIIATSPYSILSGTFWMLRKESSGAQTSEARAWLKVDDGLETTLIVLSDQPPTSDNIYGPLRGIRLTVSMPFAAPGFLAAATEAIAKRNISVLLLSTFSYDYIFVATAHVETALEALAGRGFRPLTTGE